MLLKTPLQFFKLQSDQYNINNSEEKKYLDCKKNELKVIMPSSSGSQTRIYIGNLPPDIRSKDVEDLFYKYGKIAFVDLKNKRGPPFAFVEFEDHR